MIDGFDQGFHVGLGGPGEGVHEPGHALSPDLHVDHHMYLPTDGGLVDLGTDLIDTDHDGIGDTVTLHEPDGLSVVSDIDEDGIADKVTTFGADGTYETWARGAGAHWELIEHGRIGGK
ncbi:MULTISPECIES: DUF6802 family protein [Mycobacteroides]|jgi:hypothetical protein|uniref:DUF6802 domain-containing protein n=1 Tax=Mycobacteroides chelonae TaxID=1774 RepID=A0A1S1M940_MYCCH|nr:MULTISPECIES: DUF6802 family protein [Mycobacteroides]KRQ28939.1 hypothetical protein AOT86_06700 [Mycobacteroides sp. H072]KRQ38599.1 hypothetical protein AOT84_09160 [Mycobacteroides sp. H002]KRQ48976.1 hypothetical protein AOT85_17730 [Mycobacteroides sp. H054]KRQ71576.1 hypothetical protein AOT83_08235 [Mycobacteroides sp. H001]MBF9318428.1 hypothetical protein [Mycobacteroides chelonae]